MTIDTGHGTPRPKRESHDGSSPQAASTGVTRRIAGHQLVSHPDEPVRVWQTLTTTVCHATQHDTLAASKNHGCACPTARRRAATYEKRRRTAKRARLIDAAPTARLLQALAAIGWSSTCLAPRLDLNAVSVSSIRRGAQDKVTPTTARKIGAVYRELKTTRGPSLRTATFARQQGWPPPRLAGLIRNDCQESA